MTIPMMLRRKLGRNSRPEDVVLGRALEEVRRVRDVLELRSTAPTYVYRGHCEDCGGPVVLLDGLTCEVCGSRSTVLTSQAWGAPPEDAFARALRLRRETRRVAA